MQRLYVRGRLPQGGVAIVGSRTPPPEAVDFAYALAFHIGGPVIAGLALGIDTAAHRGALDAGNPTVAFVGHGFGATYPPQNAALEREIERCGGAVATLRAPGESVTEASLVARDRLQAEYADAVVLVASEPEGGAMHTLEFARALSKPHFAVRPPDEAQGLPSWAGNLRALAGGAAPLPLDVSEALQILRARIDPVPGSR
ncbi:MAG: DNA-processing protein DprA [Candidatus Tumulicola sp.]